MDIPNTPKPPRHRGKPPLEIKGLFIEKQAEGQYRYVFSLTAPADRPLSGLFSLRVYTRHARLMGSAYGHHPIDLRAGQQTTLTVESLYLFEDTRFQYWLEERPGEQYEYVGEDDFTPLSNELPVIDNSKPSTI